MVYSPLIRELGMEEISAAALVAARAMRDNPLTTAAFGSSREVRLSGLLEVFTTVLQALNTRGKVLGAFNGRSPVGLAAIMPPGRCQLSAMDKLLLSTRIIPTVGFGGVFRAGKWLRSWERHDLHEAHWHLGPVAVDVHLQGRGIGQALVNACCLHLDQVDGIGYLETDKIENVTFYRKFEFEIVEELRAIETPTWLMRRGRRLNPRNRRGSAVWRD
jgi:ribosomal protein S18 acetylase RimI-like enzyme